MSTAVQYELYQIFAPRNQSVNSKIEAPRKQQMSSICFVTNVSSQTAKDKINTMTTAQRCIMNYICNDDKHYY